MNDKLVKLEQTVEAVLPIAPVSESAALISMIERAARDPDINIDKMERLFDMQQRAVAARAKTDYLQALAGLQAALPAVERKGRGHNNAKYARFEDIVQALRKPLTDHGFSLTYRINQPEGKVCVTGVLGHRGGHSEQTSITLPADTSGNKNVVQSFGSSTSYGKRYVSMTLTGIATEDEDDDGKKSETGELLNDEQELYLRTQIDATKTNIQSFLKYIEAESISDIPQSRFARAKAMLAKKAQQVK